MLTPSDRFAGHVAIVTGSSRGIGKACAHRLGREAADVVLNGRDADTLEQTAEGLRADGCRVACVPIDVSDPSAPAALLEAAMHNFGAIDHVVNCAASLGYFGPLLDVEQRRFDRAMTTNAWAALALAREAVAFGLGDRGGSIVNVSAGGARIGAPSIAPYVASKAALESLTRSLAVELGPHGVRVNAVSPGVVRTEFARSLWEGEAGKARAARLPLRRLGEPEDIAGAVVFLLSEEASWITGIVMDVDGGGTIAGPSS